MQIVYQPIVKLSGGDIVGYEALSRFDSGISPEEVFHNAWEEGTGVELEVRAIETAIKQFPFSDNLAYLAINASSQTVIDTRGGLVKDSSLEVPWDRIVLELSEKEEVNDYLKIDGPLSILFQRHVRLAIDDVGSGISGLGHISQMIPDILKIDRVLIRHINENPIKRSLVRAVVGIGRDLHSTVVAEGIETEEEKKWCENLGVKCGQGFLLGRPLPLFRTEDQPDI